MTAVGDRRRPFEASVAVASDAILELIAASIFEAAMAAIAGPNRKEKRLGGVVISEGVIAVTLRIRFRSTASPEGAGTAVKVNVKP